MAFTHQQVRRLRLQAWVRLDVHSKLNRFVWDGYLRVRTLCHGLELLDVYVRPVGPFWASDSRPDGDPERKPLGCLQYRRLPDSLFDGFRRCLGLPCGELKRRVWNGRGARSSIGEHPFDLLFLRPLAYFWRLRLHIRMNVSRLLVRAHSDLMWAQF